MRPRGDGAARPITAEEEAAGSKIITTKFITRGNTGPLYVFLTGSDGWGGPVQFKDIDGTDRLRHEPTEGIISECAHKGRDLVLIHNREKDTGGWDEDVVAVQHGWQERCEMVKTVIADYPDRQIILAGFSNGGGALVFGLATHRIEITSNIDAIEIICPWMVAIPAWVDSRYPPSGKPRTLQDDAHFAPIQRAYEYVRDRSHPPKMLVISSPEDKGPAGSGDPTPATPVVVEFDPFVYDNTHLTPDMDKAMRSFDTDLHEAEQSAAASSGDGVCIVWIKQTKPMGPYPCRGHSNYCGTYCGNPYTRKWVKDVVGILPGFMGIVKDHIHI